MPFARIHAVLLMIVALALPALAAPPRPDKMFPDGREHDFGQVQSGPQARHAFRIVNTSNVPLKIVSLRRA